MKLDVPLSTYLEPFEHSMVEQRRKFREDLSHTDLSLKFELKQQPW